MNFQEAEKAYQDLRAQYSAGKLSSTDFEEQVSKLKLQDPDGKWWQIGVQSGDWYVHDGQKWSKARPPLTAEPPSTPAPPPEEPTEESAHAPAQAPAPVPVPGIGPKEPRQSRVAPRFFSSKPAGRGGGLPTPLLIGIVAIVALIGLAALVGGVLFVSGQLGGSSAGAKTTPTTVAVVAPPTIGVPTITLAPIVPTATSIAVPVVVTPTAAITPTAVVTTTAVPKVVATRKATATPVKPAATATKAPNIPAGVYVTKLELDPPSPNFGDRVGFKVTLTNTTGELKVLRWLVKIFQCAQDPCTENDFRRSFGESSSQQSNIVAGTAELTVPKTWSTGMGPCTYVAMPHYYDPVTQQLLPFPQTNGQPMYYIFKMCH